MAIGPDVPEGALNAREEELARSLELMIDDWLLTNSPFQGDKITFPFGPNPRFYVSEKVQKYISNLYKQAGWRDVTWSYNQHDTYFVDLYRK